MSLFFIVFFALYLAVNYYIFIRGWQALEVYIFLRPWYLVIYIFISLAYITSKLFQRYLPDSIYMILETAGSFWFAFMLYFFLAVLLIDITRLTGLKFDNYIQVKFITFSIVLLVISIVVAAGYINTRVIAIKELSIIIPSRSSQPGELKAVLISDIHLSTMNNDNFTNGICEKVNVLKPDIILIAGDIVDDKSDYLRRYGIGYSLKTLKAKYGVFGITGNHEYINGVDSSVRFMEDMGIKTLRDSFVVIDDRIIIAGREDRSRLSFYGSKRKTLSDILSSNKHDLPIIMMDHTPLQLEDAVNNKVDFQFSGHTHHGQLFPLNFITSLIYEVSYGYLKKGNTHIYVTSGVGTWGPPVRTGSRSEIVLLKIKLE